MGDSCKSHVCKSKGKCRICGVYLWSPGKGEDIHDHIILMKGDEIVVRGPVHMKHMSDLLRG